MHPKESTDRVILNPGRTNHKTIVRFLATVEIGRSDNANAVGMRVFARRGAFLPLYLPGQRRAQRARKHGNTVESVDAHTLKVR